MFSTDTIPVAARAHFMAALTHPLETMRVHAVVDPSAPLYTAPLTSFDAYRRGILSRLLESVISTSAKSLIQKPVYDLFSKFGPNELLTADSSPWYVATARWIWTMAPLVFVNQTALLLSYPLMVFNTLACIPGLSGNMSLPEIAKTVYQKHGIRGLYAGFLPKSLATIVFTLSIQPLSMFIYNKLMHVYSTRIMKEDPLEQGESTRKASLINMALASAIAYPLNSFITLPFETLATQMQITTCFETDLPSAPVLARMTLGNYGLRLFTIGALPQSIKHILSAGLFAYLILSR